MKELEAEWAREAQGASDSDDDVVLVEPKRAAQGGGGCGTCHLRNRSTRANLTFPSSLVTCTAGGGRRRRVKVIHL
jgi:hypothetical protein